MGTDRTRSPSLAAPVIPIAFPVVFALGQDSICVGSYLRIMSDVQIYGAELTSRHRLSTEISSELDMKRAKEIKKAPGVYGASGYSVGDLEAKASAERIALLAKLDIHLLHGHHCPEGHLMACALNPSSRVEVAANDCSDRPRSEDLEWIQIPRVLSSDGTGTYLDSPVALRPRASH
jgi:hypothetical protein